MKLPPYVGGDSSLPLRRGSCGGSRWSARSPPPPKAPYIGWGALYGVPLEQAIVKDLGMALEVGDGQEETNVLPGAALYRQMFTAMVANGDGDLSLQGLITVVERLNGIGK